MPDLPSGELRLLPFRAVRYNPVVVGDIGTVTSPPYDVIDDVQRRDLEASHPRNVVRLILPREPGADAAPDATSGERTRYTEAAVTFDRWLADGTLIADEKPALYVYQQELGGNILQRGLFGSVVIEPFTSRVILPHENVRAGPVEDRLALMRALEGNPEPIYLLYDGGGATSELSAEATARTPLVSFVSPDGIEHSLWALDDPRKLDAIAADLCHRQAMIADGHHRYTTYGYLRDELRPRCGAGPWDSGLALLHDDSVASPDIRAIHRVIAGLSLPAAAAALANAFRLEELPTTAGVDLALGNLATRDGHAFLLTDGERYVIADEPDMNIVAGAKPADRTDAWWSLDASVASVFVLEQLWGVSDAAGQVEAEHDPEAAVRSARETRGIALLLKPAPLAAILSVARAGDAMPRKSTLFMPKPRSGIVMRSFRFET